MASNDTPKDLDAFISAMNDSQLHCRDYGHSWRAHSAVYIPKQRAYEQQLRCTRCKALRHRLLDRNGEVVSSHYEYQDGYLIKGLGRLTGSDRGTLRLASVRSVIDHGEGNGKS